MFSPTALMGVWVRPRQSPLKNREAPRLSRRRKDERGPPCHIPISQRRVTAGGSDQLSGKEFGWSPPGVSLIIAPPRLLRMVSSMSATPPAVGKRLKPPAGRSRFSAASLHGILGASVSDGVVYFSDNINTYAYGLQAGTNSVRPKVLEPPESGVHPTEPRLSGQRQDRVVRREDTRTRPAKDSSLLAHSPFSSRSKR